MEIMDNGSAHPVTMRHAGNIHIDEIIEANDSRKSYRPAGSNLKNTSCITQVTKLNSADDSRLEALKEDILYFRNMLEQMVRNNHGEMDYYASILKSCNSTLGGNYHKMHKRYLDLLNQTQEHEAKLHLHALEDELAMLSK